MMLFELLETLIGIYMSLGFGTNEYKIEAKMEKIKCDHPKAYEIYVQNKVLFETDAVLSKKILDLNVKNKMAVNNTIKEVYVHFGIAA